ncbi:MAG: hypothetical protein HDR15_05170 [Lachnospiraceae bacterium]|nr:hypothetical protein [Lachnospiraceae bacterium]
MDRNDEWQQLIDEYREMQVPQSARDRIQDAILRGKKHAAKRRRAAYIRTAVSGAAAVVLILVLLPNLNAHVADRMGRVPVVGRFFKTVTLREYSGANTESAADENGAPMALDAGTDIELLAEDDAVRQDADVAAGRSLAEPTEENGIAALSDDPGVPVEGSGMDAGGYTERIVECFEEENARDGGHLELTGYEVVTDSDEWFTLIIYANERGGTENHELRRYYNIDKRRDMVMTLGELYNGRDYVRIISDEILSQMGAGNAQSSAEDTVTQETRKEKSEIVVFTQIDENQNYYINEDGNLVIVLDQSQTSTDEDGHSEYVILTELLE